MRNKFFLITVKEYEYLSLKLFDITANNIDYIEKCNLLLNIFIYRNMI